MKQHSIKQHFIAIELAYGSLALGKSGNSSKPTTNYSKETPVFT